MRDVRVRSEVVNDVRFENGVRYVDGEPCAAASNGMSTCTLSDSRKSWCLVCRPVLMLKLRDLDGDRS